MIVDSLVHASRYFGVHPLLEEAFQWIKANDLAAMEPGKYAINADGSLKAIISDKAGMTKEASTAKFECHNEWIDIQLCVSGLETLGWKPREKCVTENGAYNPEKDVQLYSDAPDTFFELTDGQFALFFPSDVHAPMIGEGNIKKLVIKVKI